MNLVLINWIDKVEKVCYNVGDDAGASDVEGRVNADIEDIQIFGSERVW